MDTYKVITNEKQAKNTIRLTEQQRWRMGVDVGQPVHVTRFYQGKTNNEDFAYIGKFICEACDDDNADESKNCYMNIELSNSYSVLATRDFSEPVGNGD